MATRLEWSGKHRRYIRKETLTAGEARAILTEAEERGLSGMARANKSLTKQQAWDILSDGIANILDDEPIPAIIAKNISVEFR